MGWLGTGSGSRAVCGLIPVGPGGRPVRVDCVPEVSKPPEGLKHSGCRAQAAQGHALARSPRDREERKLRGACAQGAAEMSARGREREQSVCIRRKAKLCGRVRRYETHALIPWTRPSSLPGSPVHLPPPLPFPLHLPAFMLAARTGLGDSPLSHPRPRPKHCLRWPLASQSQEPFPEEVPAVSGDTCWCLARGTLPWRERGPRDPGRWQSHCACPCPLPGLRSTPWTRACHLPMPCIPHPAW